jgi:chemotaxis protein histidine kinase CheA
MGPDSLPPMEIEKKSVNLWLVAIVVFVTGLGAGVFIPAGLKHLGLVDAKVPSNKESANSTASNINKLRRIDPPLSHAAVTETDAPKAEVKLAAAPKKEKIEKPKQRLAAAAFRSNKDEKKAEKAVAKIEKPAPAPVKEEPAAKAKSKDMKVAKAEKAPAPSAAADLIEEVPSALTAVQVEKLMQTNSVALAKNQKALARPVSLPPSQNLNAAPAVPQTLSALPILKTDPRGESKTYPVSINNASFSKANLANCTKRCALMGMDALGNPIKAIIDGNAYASALMQHNGTINISGQPRIIKNQQILVVENITFNLAPTTKAVAKRGRAAAVAPVPVNDKAAGYTEVSFEGDDLKPGTVIKNRKQIPIEDQQEIPAP